MSVCDEKFFVRIDSLVLKLVSSFFEELGGRQNKKNNTSSGFLFFESGLEMMGWSEQIN